MPIQTKKTEQFSVCADKSKNAKIEILSIRLENEDKLPYKATATKPFDFFDRSSQLDRSTVTWYFGKIKADLGPDGQKSSFSLPHWFIKTNNPDLFNFMNNRFDRIDLIFGQEKTYWKFSRSTNVTEMIEGETELDIGTCSCCMDTQFPRIIEALRKQYRQFN